MQKHKYAYYAFSLLLLILSGAVGFYNNPRTQEPQTTEENYEYTGQIPYAYYFQLYAPNINWPWQMLAALCYEESHYNPHARSASGALGLMQLMPKTAKRFGLNDSTIYSPQDNIRAGVEYIAFLQKKYSFITDSAENINFVLASYNAGPAHIMDARRLAKKHGRSAYVWFGNTEYWLAQLQYEQYANDSVVRFGQFNPAQTINYVHKVHRTYRKILLSEP